MLILSATSALPLDLSSIITNLGVFSLAVAAVVGGIYKAIQEVKKSGATAPALAATAILDAPTTQKMLSTFAVLTETLVKVERHLDKMYENGHDLRENVRNSTEEMHRLRVAVVDLHQHLRATNR